MLLSPGTTLAQYQIVAALGAGGMGEVYRARDTRLNRDVALKVLSEQFARDPERLQRFRREAHTLAALNHPHIAQIYGFEDTSNGHALVMELVDGEDLAARLARGPVPLDESIPIAAQMAEALEAAHEQGIVHRDLKPANVKVRPDGSVKVLDFGLAKALDAHSTSSPAVGSMANSPTITSPAAMTGAGMILGTAAYMSPEQARGKPVDRRADIWAFGVVLYEMLTGRRAFAGETVTDVLAAVISGEPDWDALPPGVPASVRQLLRRCVEKDQRIRLRDIGEARIALLTGATMPSALTVAPSSAAAGPTGFARLLPWTVAALAGILAIAAWLVRPSSTSAPPRRLELALPSDGAGFSLSPNGTHIAFLAGGHVRVIDLERFESRDLATASTARRTFLFWSPDAAFVGYDTPDGRLWTIPLSGGTPLVVCTIPESSSLVGATWRSDGSIVFAVEGGNLYQVRAAGGDPTPVLTIDPSREFDFHDPVAMPNGRVLVATHLRAAETGGPGERYRLEMIDGQRRETVLESGFLPVAYVSPGYLLVRRIGSNAGLWGFAFSGGLPLNPDSGIRIAADAQTGSAAADGTVLYSLTPSTEQSAELVWVDRTGQVTGAIGSPQSGLATPVFSPDGQRLAYSARAEGNMDIWIRDIARNVESRFTFESGVQARPAWFPSGRRLAYAEGAAGESRLVGRNADGSGGIQTLGNGFLPNISQNGKYVTYLVDDRLRYSEVLPDGSLGPATGVLKSTPEPLVLAAALSPDGSFVAYAERQPDRRLDVFMTKFPSGDGRWQISRGGGRAPVWARTGAELMFVAGGPGGPTQMMAVSVSPGSETVVGTQVKLFDVDAAMDLSLATANYAVTADGKQFVMIRMLKPAGTQAAPRWIFVQNWKAESRPVR